MNIRRHLQRCLLVSAVSVTAFVPVRGAAAEQGTVESAPPKPAKIKKATCRVLTVLARKEGESKIPSNLKLLEKELRSDQFAAYKSFELLEEKRLKVGTDKSAAVKTRLGYTVSMQVLGGDKNRMKLHVILKAGDSTKPLFDADYTVQNNGVLLVVAGMRDKGRVIFAFQCRADS